MGKPENSTSLEQVVIDNVLTEESDKEQSRHEPFNFALEAEISRVQSASIENTVDDSINIAEIPEYYTSRNIGFQRSYSNLLQGWIGHVIEIKDEIFIGELIDLLNPTTKEVAEFAINTISPDDRRLIEMGATFYWTISLKMKSGQLSKESIVRFQRVVNWEESDYDQAADIGRDLFENLTFE